MSGNAKQRRTRRRRDGIPADWLHLLHRRYVKFHQYGHRMYRINAVQMTVDELIRYVIAPHIKQQYHLDLEQQLNVR